MARRNTNATFSLDSAEIMRQVRTGVNKELQKKLTLWAKTVDRNVTRGAGLKQAHNALAETARSKALSAYTNSDIGDRPSYRMNDRKSFRRYAGGKMEQALQHPGTITSDARGISYIDKSEMDKFARQWWRLNFGSPERGSVKPPSAKPMTFMGVTTSARASLDMFGPSEIPVMMPSGWWSSSFEDSTKGARLGAPTGNDAFYAYRKKKGDRPTLSKGVELSRPRMETQGIEGKRFLDAGASYINQQYPRKLSALFKKWLEV